MEFISEKKKKKIPPISKTSKTVLFSLLILIIVSVFLLFNKAQREASIYSFNSDVNSILLFLF